MRRYLKSSLGLSRWQRLKKRRQQCLLSCCGSLETIHRRLKQLKKRNEVGRRHGWDLGLVYHVRWLRNSGVGLAAVLVAVLSGCGGKSTVYDASATQACLVAHGMTVSHDDADYIAIAAANGGYMVTVGATSVDISFERDGHGAETTLNAYQALGGTDAATVYSKGNAVFSWDDTPTSDERAAVDDCLVAG